MELFLRDFVILALMVVCGGMTDRSVRAYRRIPKRNDNRDLRQ